MLGREYGTNHARLPYVRIRLLIAATAMLASACGPRTDRVSGMWRPRAPGPEATVAATPEPAPASELPTGDPKLQNAAVALGKPPPELDVSEWANSERPILLRDLGGRPVLLHFCRLNDDACAKDRAVLRDLWERHAKYGFLVLDVFVDQPSAHTPPWEHWAAMRTGIKSLDDPWPAAFGERVTYTLLKYGIGKVPAAYLVSGDGKLVWTGTPTAQEKSLRDALEAIVGQP